MISPTSSGYVPNVLNDETVIQQDHFPAEGKLRLDGGEEGSFLEPCLLGWRDSGSSGCLPCACIPGCRVSVCMGFFSGLKNSKGSHIA